jgi:hypothetical protein
LRTSVAATDRTVVGHSVTGTFTLWAAAPRANPCAARADAADIHPGTEVAIKTAAGATIATTTLSPGRSDATHRGCVYRFEVATLPANATFSVTVGTRSGLTYNPKDVARAGWQIALNLGLPDRAGTADGMKRFTVTH